MKPLPLARLVDFPAKCLEHHPRTCELVISMVSKSPKDRVVGPLPNDHSWLINAGDPNHLITNITNWDDPPSGLHKWFLN